MLDSLREFLRPFYLRNIYFPLFPKRKPSYFSDCWRYEDHRLPSSMRDLPVIFFLPMNDWHTRLQRTQHLAQALSRRGYCCVYLNPHLGREFPRSYDRGQTTRVTQLAPNLIELHVHLPREPVFHHRLLTAAESGLLAQAVSDLIQQLRPSRVVQVLAFPVWLPAALLLRSRHSAPIFYDCHDYLPGFSRIALEILNQEPELLRSSDLVVCSSASLLERAESLASQRTVLIRNAAASELLCIVRTVPSVVTIGYIGALDSWFDVPSLRAASVAHRDWRFRLIGRIENEKIRELGNEPNIDFLGEIPFARLPEHLAAFTVGTIPFRLNPLIEATDPIKVYEYLAAGLPVVAADLPELRRFANFVSRYTDPADFVRKLEAAVALETPDLIAQRRALAETETWERRAEQLALQLDLLANARDTAY